MPTIHTYFSPTAPAHYHRATSYLGPSPRLPHACHAAQAARIQPTQALGVYESLSLDTSAMPNTVTDCCWRVAALYQPASYTDLPKIRHNRLLVETELRDSLHLEVDRLLLEYDSLLGEETSSDEDDIPHEGRPTVHSRTTVQHLSVMACEPEKYSMWEVQASKKAAPMGR
ncbi:hypothetical protein SNOG_09152 [Parastagonospora nodorum SN15]|uniref:Uncharacterized protein n=1 Tax=Phaeosphaeria nodorum (strain SN15 / ATCC MYA-4574 / FGSC 10173) TaxID=321614 RepID=Q0UGG2_PHANO|nr:hypothetical protein SNOG_09152 [Parastagonospora nodorum SN15]EAT83344.1 hypothetical protein SNOG_09152 [Parastagonospora nodorum SN15]